MTNLDERKVMVLKEKLKKIGIKELKKRQQIILEIIGFMNKGVNVSDLFNEMIKASQTTDLVQKKLINLYLLTHSSSHPETAIMAVNTFIKDTENHSPFIRGLALRSMSSLNNTELLEYITPQVIKLLGDNSGYVRRIAVMSVVKLWRLDPKALDIEQVKFKLYKMVLDQDPQVLVNAVLAINTLFQKFGGIVLNSEIVSHFLKRLSSLSKWGMGIILGLIAKYAPQNEEESLSILNHCDGFLAHENSYVVLSASKVLVNLVEDLPNLKTQIFQRVKEPLLTMISCKDDEISYSVLKHIHLIATQQPKIFFRDYNKFFILKTDKSYLRNVKLDILTEIIYSNNVQHIIEEISSYVTNSQRDQKYSRKAIFSLSKIIRKYPKYSKYILQELISFIDLEIGYIIESSIIIMKDILQILPSAIEMIKKYIEIISKLVIDFETETVYTNLYEMEKEMEKEGEMGNVSKIENQYKIESKCSLIWICGQYSEDIEKSPYILESFIENFQKLTTRSKLELLTATIKLFCKRPAESQKMLGLLLKISVQKQNNVDVIDRSLFYYRILKTGIQNIQKIIFNQDLNEKYIYIILDENRNELLDELLDDFNSLSLIYDKPYYQINNNYQIFLKGAQEQEGDQNNNEFGNDEYEDEDEDDDSGVYNSGNENKKILNTGNVNEKKKLIYINKNDQNQKNSNLVINKKEKEFEKLKEFTSKKEKENGDEFENKNNFEKEKEGGREREKEKEKENENEKENEKEKEKEKGYQERGGGREREKEKEKEKTNENNLEFKEGTNCILDSKAILTPNNFESEWIKPKEEKTITFFFKNNISKEKLMDKLKENHIMTIASGIINKNIKLFCYAQRIFDQEFILIELIYDDVENKAVITLKSEKYQFIQEFSNYILSFLSFHS
ncbi:ap-4 complex subunit beta-1 [Anaeramoeba flamelloides]|uniref:AP complex subunit beta n=1 Tax=Anaeramoeba flamelloides TaxID=1746091 RepID=A0AAV7YK64_9EUKA|nr:ap-4 complex subunit beta-1 [Anaeramoeba flamelloides]